MKTGTGSLLRSGNIKDYTPLGEEGNPVYKWAAQIRVAIKRKVSSDSVSVFAIPQGNENGDVIDWYAPESGPVIPWSSATREEKIVAKEQLSIIHQKLIVSEDVNHSEDGDQSIFKQLLEHVLQFPDDEHVYLVNGKPVITFWGFVETDGNSRSDPLAVLTIPKDQSVVESISVHDNVVEVIPVKKRRFSWWWLLALLLLLLFLLFLLRGCDEVSEVPVLQKRTNAIEADPISVDIDIDRNIHSSRRIDRNVIHDRTAINRVNRNEVLNDDKLRFDRDGIEDINQESLSETNAEATAKKNEQEMADELSKKDAEAMSDDGSEQSKLKDDEKTETPLDEKGLPEKNNDNQASPSQTENPQSLETPPLQKPLAIPEGSNKQKSMNFLNGRWQANSGIMDEQGRPVNLEYDFKDGKGNVKMVKNDGTICSSAVEAKMNGSELMFSDQNAIKCPNGNSYQLAKVKCKADANNQTVCNGAFKDGEDFKMDIKKSAEIK